jgi:phosphatidate phosphatase LPIN
LWGTLAGILRKKKRRRFSSIEDGIYLDELDGGNFNEEEIAKYFPKPHLSNQPSPPTYSPVSEMEISDDTTSGIESSPSLSPYHTNITTTTTTSDNDNIDNIISILSDVSLSCCGSNGGNLDSITDDMFIQSQISFADFCSNPVNILNNPDLVVRINNRYYSWQVAGPMIMSCLVFAQTLPQPIHDNLTRSDMLKKSSRQSFWNFWGQKQNYDRTTSTGNNGTASTTSNGTNATVTTASSTAAGMEDLLLRDDETASEGTLIEVAAPPSMMTSSSWLTSSGGYSSLSSDDEESGSVTEGRRQQRLLKRKKFIFTNELTSDQLVYITCTDKNYHSLRERCNTDKVLMSSTWVKSL